MLHSTIYGPAKNTTHALSNDPFKHLNMLGSVRNLANLSKLVYFVCGLKMTTYRAIYEPPKRPLGSTNG